MNTHELARAVVEVGKYGTTLAARLLQRYWVTVIIAAVAVSLLLSSWAWLREQRMATYTLLDGPAGGAGRTQAARIAAEVANQSSALGFQYSVNTVHTNGFEENLNRVSQDVSGRLLGLTQDGFGDPESVRVLLPLEANYLHLLCREEFLRQEGLLPRLADGGAATGSGDAAPATRPTTALTLADVAPHLKPGRVFLGPKGSGTRQVAQIVLSESLALDPGKYQCHGVNDWHDMRAALATGHVDLAFHIGPLGSESVVAIARDRSSVLLDLGSDAAALQQRHPYIAVAKLARNLYPSSNGFCATDLQVLSTRRVLIASRYMSDRDAYFLAAAAQNALPIADPSGEGIADVGKRLRYRPHPGALYVWDNRTFSYIPQGLAYFFLTLALAVLIEFARFVSVRLQAISAAANGAAPPPAADYLTLFDQLEDLHAEVETSPHPLPDEDRLTFARRLRHLREQVVVSAEAGQLADRQKETLLAGIRAVMREVFDGSEVDRRAAVAVTPPLHVDGEPTGSNGSGSGDSPTVVA